jgi:flavodoxin
MNTCFKTDSLAMLKQWTFRGVIILLLAACLINIPTTSYAQESSAGKILILYYSRTGNTRMTCETLQKALNAQLIEIKDLTDRSGSWGGLTGMLNTLFNMETGIEPEHPDLSTCSTIILASPLWAGKLAPAIRTLIGRNKFDNKRVIIFTTGNAILDQVNQEKNKALVKASGGQVVGYMQVAVQEKINDKKVDKPKDQVLADTVKLVPEIKKAFSLP